MSEHILTICYLVASVTFILGLKMLSHPATARKGNLFAAAGMSVAIVGTIFLPQPDGTILHNYGWIFGGLLIGAVVGTLAAKKVKMTAMPEMVSLFNGMGGACAALISLVEFDHVSKELAADPSLDISHIQTKVLIIVLGLIIGSVSFAGSIIAWGKLNGKIKDFSFPGQNILNLVLLALALGAGAYLVIHPGHSLLFYGIFVLSLLYGVLFVMPIGGADMPVVISLLNSFTGVAAACGGFLYENKVMLTGGILVGAAGTLLTILMCKAMNRSLKNVLIGSFGASNAAAASAGVAGHYKEVSLSDAAMLMSYANKVMVVPGYGLAVAQAQHTCHELEKILNEIVVMSLIPGTANTPISAEDRYPSISLEKIKAARPYELLELSRDEEIIGFMFTTDLDDNRIGEAYSTGNQFSAATVKLIQQLRPGRLVTIDLIRIRKDGKEIKMPSKVYMIVS